jgi:hypothetical protein
LGHSPNGDGFQIEMLVLVNPQESTCLASGRLVYRVFDCAIRTTLEFPELVITEPGANDFDFEVNRPQAEPETPAWIHHWFQDDDEGDAEYSIGHLPDGYLFRFGGKADFRIFLPERKIVCIPLTGINLNTIRHLLLDHVLPRVLVREDELSIHASAIQVPSGKGVAFLANSGWGKSTLAQSFAETEARLLGDDCLKLQVRGNKLLGIPSYSGMRLWSDSLTELFPQGVETLTLGGETSKQRVIKPQSGQCEIVAIDELFFLTDPRQQTGDEIRIEKIAGAEAMMAFVKRSFLLDVGSRNTASSQFRTIQRILDTRPNLYALSYPRRYDYLPRVRQRILSVVESGLLQRGGATAVPVEPELFN